MTPCWLVKFTGRVEELAFAMLTVCAARSSLSAVCGIPPGPGGLTTERSALRFVLLVLYDPHNLMQAARLAWHAGDNPRCLQLRFAQIILLVNRSHTHTHTHIYIYIYTRGSQKIRFPSLLPPNNFTYEMPLYSLTVQTLVAGASTEKVIVWKNSEVKWSEVKWSEVNYKWIKCGCRSGGLVGSGMPRSSSPPDLSPHSIHLLLTSLHYFPTHSPSLLMQ
jgi:hypothetical protein